ncbi:MAG: 4Fe-4S dicluster domain-containing protein [Myxococcota bacterium]
MKLYEWMRKPPWFMSVSNWVTDEDDPVRAGPNARKAVLIPLLVLQYGSLAAKLRSVVHIRRYVARSLVELRNSARGIRDNPHTGTRSIDAETLRELETLATSLGVTGIGYTKVNPDHIFEGFEILYDNAILFTMAMDREAMASNPSPASNAEIFRTYAGLGVAVNEIAQWLRDRGFDCQASPAIGGDINTVPTAQDANLGHIGKNGILVTPEHGPCVRLAAIFVDIDNLPLAETHDHGWIEGFCDTCNLCVRACPGGAIHETPRYRSADRGGGRVFIEREKCAPAFSEGCSRCITSCPFVSGRYDRIREVYERRQARRAERVGGPVVGR